MSAAEQERDAAINAVTSALGAIRELADAQAKIDAAGQFSRDLREASDEAGEIRETEVLSLWRTGQLSMADLARRTGISKTRVHQIIQAARREHEVTQPVVKTKPEMVVAAIVTSPKGVLVGRRIDGKPLWTFIAGEREEGEAPEQTAAREVWEETGLRVTAAEVIGERKHPRTKRWMAYVAATPTDGTDVFVGDADELAEVRWVSLAEADLLMGGTIYEPVHEYLSRTLKS